MRLHRLAAATTAVLALAAGEALAAPTVAVEGGQADGSSATVSGVAAFPAVTGPQSVVNEGSGRAGGEVGGSPVGDALGLGLTDARIAPLPDGSGLRFTWVVSDLPDQTPPEGVRYTWGFEVGGSAFQFVAKRTNLGSINTVDDPVGHAQSTTEGSFFQLRGGCGAEYRGVPLNGCFHVAFLDGAFDTTANTISIDLPFNPRDSVGRFLAPDFKPGAVILDSGAGSAGGTIQASMQAVVTNATLSRSITAVSSYFVGPKLQLGVGRSTQAPAGVTYTTTVVPGPDGAFTATVPGLTAKDRTVFARACNGVECAFSKLDLP